MQGRVTRGFPWPAIGRLASHQRPHILGSCTLSSEKSHMAAPVNLDALITREDFEVSTAQNPAVPTATIQVRDLEQTAFFYSALRKPDFQRETSEWEPQRVYEFVKSFLDGDLIPAIILWRSGAYTFVIDGAHRLSALISWVHDDYGDGPRSRAFFNEAIPQEQLRAAKATRDLINKYLGSYAQHQSAASSPANASPEILSRARNLAALGIQLQWVTGDAKKAEASFFKINQSAATIDKTELKLLQARRKPYAIAARALIRAGTGHKYWSTFTPARQGEIESVASDIYKTLFLPEFKTPIKTLDLPVAGRGYSSETLSLVVDFVALANRQVDADHPDDPDGSATLKCLHNCHDIARRLAGTHPGSLALHPAVYFYSAAGRYQPSAFLAVVALVMDLEKSKDGFNRFTLARSSLESTLLGYKHVVNQFVRKHGSNLRSHKRIMEFYKAVIRVVCDVGIKAPAAIIAEVVKDPQFAFLQQVGEDDIEYGKDFSNDSKSAVFLRDALKAPLHCAICNGYLIGSGATIDHVVRKADGGKGTPDNGQLAHPYCNSTLKN